MNSHQEVRIHFLDYWRVVRVRLGLVIFVFLCVVITTGLATYLAPREYRSLATIEVTSEVTPVPIFENQTEAPVIDDSRFSRTQFQIMRAAGQLNLKDPIIEAKLPVYQTARAEKAKLLSSGLGSNHPDVKALQAQIDTIAEQLRQQIESIRKGFLTQLAIAESSLTAMGVNLQASQIEQQVMKTASARYLDAKYKYIQERKFLEAAKSQLNSESMGRDMPQKPAFIREPAEPALLPSKPNVKINMFLGIAAGIVLGLSLAFFLEYLHTGIKTMEEVEKLLEIPVLAVIPKGINLLPRMDEDSPDAEGYRILKTNVDFSRKKTDAIALNVTSGSASEGKSITVCNLATTWAASAQRVLIVNADLRRPSQHRIFEVNNRVGLSAEVLPEPTRMAPLPRRILTK
jgi:polysaccharide biosynthesis transport protein